MIKDSDLRACRIPRLDKLKTNERYTRIRARMFGAAHNAKSLQDLTIAKQHAYLKVQVARAGRVGADEARPCVCCLSAEKVPSSMLSCDVVSCK